MSEWEIFYPSDIKSKIELSDRWYRLIIAMIELAKIGPSKPETTILEVGCGIGGFCIWASNKSDNVVGLDIARTRVHIAKKTAKKIGRRINFIVGDAQSLPFKHEICEIIVCSETLEHVPNYQKAFDELLRVTKKSGHVIVTVPNYINMTTLYLPVLFLTTALSRLKGEKPQPIDLNLFNVLKIRRLFTRKELRILAIRGIGLLRIFLTNEKIKSLEKKLEKPRDKIKFLCINIGVIAQKVKN